jgi:hypothetical protein
VGSCSSPTTTNTVYETQVFIASVDGTGFPAENEITLSQNAALVTGFENTIVFPGLIVTQLTPGDIITLVCPSLVRSPESC